MPNASNAALNVEQGATLNAYAALTDSGDHQVFTNADDIWSGKSGFEPIVRPNGIVTGRNLLSPHADNNKVTVAAFTAYSMGVLQTVAATTATIVRSTDPETHIINSITMKSDGTIEVVTGTEHANAFSETRGAAGGPPLIAVDSVELGQVRTTGFAAAVIAAGEIFQTIGTHTERYDYPTWTVNNIGEGIAADVAAQTNAFVKMASALPLSHTGPIARKVWMQHYDPVMSEVTRVLDFVPPETSYSVSSKQFYQGSIGSRSESLGQGSFTALLSDGVGDALVQDKGEVLTFKFFPDKNKSPFLICQGALGISRTFPVADQIQAACTITAEVASSEFNS
jgi:hypothetical protein